MKRYQSLWIDRRSLTRATLALLPGLLLGGCLIAAPAQRPTLPNLIWPPPPETARIALLDIVQRPEDLGISPGALSRLWRAMVGRQEVAIGAPHGVACDAAGRLYVVDRGLRQVHLFDAAGQRHLLIPQTGAPLQNPIDVAVDERRGRIFVSDSGNAAVRIFDRNGAPAGEIRRGALARPTGLAIHPRRDELLVVDSENATLMRFSLADLQPAGILGHSGKAAGQFNSPTAVAVSGSGDIFVVDTLNHRVQIFAETGEFLRSFGAAGDAPGYFSRPKAIAVDPDGHLHVVDALFDNVQVFNQQGELLLAYAGPGNEAGQLWLPSGIDIDRRGRVYVADTYNRRVQVFQYLREGELIE